MTPCLVSPAAGGTRSGRVVRVLGLVVLLSLVDLALTIGFARTMGMSELNPIAAALGRATGSSAVVAVFKLATIAVPVLMLYRLRRCPAAEVGTWISLAVLVALTIQWVRYTNGIAELDFALFAEMTTLDRHWIRLR